ncbi:Pyruvate kinase [Candidatus Tiddalikarchaeum anstoanum]|nr:Pyruvate kinase [Candidatus Tiddalikarchaeum anstoanum]
MNNTKILCTVGPASIAEKVIRDMYDSGMNACRINLSYGNFEQYSTIIANIRKIGDIPIILDTAGPELRVLNNDAKFEKGDVLDIDVSANISHVLTKGMTLLINDGANSAKVTDVNKKKIKILMENNGILVKNRKLVVKGVNFNLPLLSEKDVEGLNFAVKKDIDFVAVSFTNSADDIKTVRDKLKNSGVKILAKIESKLGVDNFEEILKTCDGVMVARGDLGVEIASERIPLIQKMIIRKCNNAGKPVIVATQMMESMITNNTPTRAETSDVANAVIDGADTVMLSGETSIGRHPALVVKAMRKICRLVEESRITSFDIVKNMHNLITLNAFKIAEELNGKIICLTRSGYTARMISRFSKANDIIAVTENDNVKRQLMISYGVSPLMHNIGDDNDKVIRITRHCLNNKIIKKDDVIVFVAGLFLKNTTNTIIVYKAGELVA